MRKKEHDPHILDKIIGIILFLAVAIGFILGMLKLSEKTVWRNKPIIEHKMPDSLKFTCVHCGWENTMGIFDVIDTLQLDSIQKAAWKK